jgi:3-phenylpropionate/trans-cinnamate dioxygenase ferredoxin reductase subunit
MSPDRSVGALLIGGGLASAHAAATLREEGYDGSITLAGREADPPYDRPPCSKGYLRGESSREDAHVHPADWYGENDVELLTRTSVTALDPDAREATLSTKETIGFKHALVATGAMVRRLNVDGSDLEEIHYLRALGNADHIRDGVADAERVVLIGGSYIGCEVAASLSKLGKRCAIVMQEDVTLERGFGAQAGRFFQARLEDHGVEIHGGQDLERFEGDGRVARVVTSGGLVLDADAVVIGAGAIPDVMLAKKAGLEIGDSGGVRCSSRLETSAPGIYAAGDMCEYESVVHGRPMRIEHWDVAAEQGKTAALNIMGRETDHDAVPYFFSDLADYASLEYVGPATDGWDEEIVRGSLDDGEFSIFYVKDGAVAAALSVGRSGDLDPARSLITDSIDVGGRLVTLADTEADLAQLG